MKKLGVWVYYIGKNMERREVVVVCVFWNMERRGELGEKDRRIL